MGHLIHYFVFRSIRRNLLSICYWARINPNVNLLYYQSLVFFITLYLKLLWNKSKKTVVICDARWQMKSHYKFPIERSLSFDRKCYSCHFPSVFRAKIRDISIRESLFLLLRNLKMFYAYHWNYFSFSKDTALISIWVSFNIYMLLLK